MSDTTDSGREQEEGGDALERRSSVRVRQPYAVRLRGVDDIGSFEQMSFVDDLSAGGLYVRLTRRPDPGTRVTAVVMLPTGAAVAGRGHVLRLEPLGSEQWGVAVQFTRTRLGRLQR